jgi:hypothetical protein
VYQRNQRTGRLRGQDQESEDKERHSRPGDRDQRTGTESEDKDQLSRGMRGIFLNRGTGIKGQGAGIREEGTGTVNSYPLAGKEIRNRNKEQKS